MTDAKLAELMKRNRQLTTLIQQRDGRARPAHPQPSKAKSRRQLGKKF